VTNVTFIFQISPNTQLWQKRGGDMAYYVTPSKKVGGKRPPCPPPNWAPGCNTEKAVWWNFSIR